MKNLDEGSVIGSYRVIRLLGQGGMGTVYEVEHIELGVHYALKTFTFDPNDEHADILKTKFLEEGKVLARLKHPNIAHVFDLAFDAETQSLYFVMDLVTYDDGESYTAEDVDQGDITEDLVYGWFRQLASALDYIHGEGIVHRDIKPSNLLVDKDLNVVLTDFGISRIFGKKIKTDVEVAKTMVTKTGRGKLVLGTEKYMAPEVAEGAEATPEADAYSLGVMLLRWLTGFHYKDNPGCISLLANKKYKWLPVVAQLIAPANRRPATYTDLVRKLKPPAANPAHEKQHEELKAKRRKRDVLRTVFTIAFWLAAVGVGAWFGYQGWVQHEQRRKEQFELLEKQQQEMKRQMLARDEAARQEKAEAEARRIAEEKRELDERARRQKAAEEKRRREAEERVRITAPEAMPAVDVAGKEERKKRSFVDEDGEMDERDYGPIPEKTYTWLRGGDSDSPTLERFLLANNATIDLVPFRATTFYMTNEDGDAKGWHKVTLTRPFWMSKTPVTVSQWREFAADDCDDCAEVEKALNGRALLYVAFARASIEGFCEFLTKKYRKQLPQGYVFRLPTDAEWEYALDCETVAMKYNQPGRGWGDSVGMGGRTFRERFAPIRGASPVLQQIQEDGGWPHHRYRVGGLSMPLPSGVLDVYGWTRWILDKWPRGELIPYADEETDPLRMKEGWDCWRARDWDRQRSGRHERQEHMSHIVLGPNLVREKAWERQGTTIDLTKAVVPKQAKKFDEKKIPGKISKPREIALKRVGGKEMVFCEIPKGKFNMSNVDGQAKRYHKVELTRPFWMSKYFVTADEWREFAANDFQTHDVRTAERLFPKHPVSVKNRCHRWTAYCEFLTKRYGHLLPKDYVFRLPTEAEWEWAFISDEKGDIRKMAGDFWSHNGRVREEFAEMLKKAKASKDFSTEGFLGRAYVGGRTRRTGFGVYDIVVNAWRDPFMLDTFDTEVADDRDWGRQASAVDNIQYDEREVDPIRYAGRCASHVEVRGGSSRTLRPDDRWEGYAHVVIAPDILKPLKEQEVAEFPMEDFGGVFLGDGVTRADQSSTHEDWRNSEQRVKRMVSRENVIVAKFDKRDDTRGFHTKSEDSPWIMLDLGKPRRVTGLAIDGFNGKTRHLCVWGSNDGKKRYLLTKEELERKRYRIDLQRHGNPYRYLIIGREQNLQKDWFFLDKVVIYGKDR